MPLHLLISRVSVMHKQNSQTGNQNTLDMIILMKQISIPQGKKVFSTNGAAKRMDWSNYLLYELPVNCDCKKIEAGRNDAKCKYFLHSLSFVQCVVECLSFV